VSIRKTGSATGSITEIEGAPGEYEGMSGVVKAAQRNPMAGQLPFWDDQDEQALQSENQDGSD
jgi:hypothetical protein